MQVVVTGVAGFIGYHLASALLRQGAEVIGIDDFNGYYDVALKHARVAQLQSHAAFTLIEGDIAEGALFEGLLARFAEVSHIVHLAAQAGVRQSVRQPHVYLRSNGEGQLQVLEYARRLPRLQHMVYASSSSAYGEGCELPFREEELGGAPLSFYGVTKRNGELMAAYYQQQYGVPLTGLRLFTCYGPWGRPDMAYYQFTQALYRGEPIRLFYGGQMRRDFTYVDDTVSGICAALQLQPQQHQCINIGNSQSETVRALLEALEQATGRTAVTENVERHMAEPVATCADISRAQAVLGFYPETGLNTGIEHFVAWFCDYHGVS